MQSSYASLEDALQAVGDTRNERPFRCGVHEDHQASASVNVAKGLWCCYTCHAAGKVDGAQFQSDAKDEMKSVLALLEDTEAIGSVQMLDLYTSTMDPYWRSRFTPEAVEHFQLGYDPVSECPVYPMYDSAGEYLGVVKRSNGQPKYKYPPGVHVHELLFNYRAARIPNVVLTEGAMDVVACWEAGIRAFGIYGSHLSPRQTELVAKCSPKVVHLWFDNDKAGQLATERADELLTDWGLTTARFPWKYYPFTNDVGELSTIELLRMAGRLFV